MTNKKTALITGASGDIGRALCKGFRKKGWRVIATDRVDSELIDANHFINMDLDRLCNDENYCTDKIGKIKLFLSGRLDLLINNAALQIVGPIKEIRLQDWQRTLNTNLTAPFVLSVSLLDELKATNGSIINVSSIHAKLTKSNFSAYATSKAGLSGLTRSLAVEVGDEVRVNAISPAAIDTKMLRQGFTNTENGLENLSNYHPSKSIGLSVDVFEAALYLANGNKFVNGMEMTLDGAISNRLHDPQ